MPRFSQSSLQRLSTCHPALVDLFETVVEEFDCTCLQGHRGQAEQDAAFDEGRSKLRWPHGKHNTLPSLAVDVAPYPVDWGETGPPEKRRQAIIRFYHFAGYVLGVARMKGLKIRFGGDWDGDRDLWDQRFMDLVHFELVLPISEARPPEQIA